MFLELRNIEIGENWFNNNSELVVVVDDVYLEKGDLPVVVKTHNEFCRHEYDEGEVEFLKEITENGWYLNEKGARVVEEYAFVITTKNGEW